MWNASIISNIIFKHSSSVRERVSHVSCQHIEKMNNQYVLFCCLAYQSVHHFMEIKPLYGLQRGCLFIGWNFQSTVYLPRSPIRLELFWFIFSKHEDMERQKGIFWLSNIKNISGDNGMNSDLPLMHGVDHLKRTKSSLTFFGFYNNCNIFHNSSISMLLQKMVVWDKSVLMLLTKNRN